MMKLTLLVWHQSQSFASNRGNVHLHQTGISYQRVQYDVIKCLTVQPLQHIQLRYMSVGPRVIGLCFSCD